MVCIQCCAERIQASPSSYCQGYQSRKLSEDDVKSIVDQHNKLRSKVAIGKEQGQPSAANMLQLIWDNELAQIAQRWADQCNFSHDKCRDVDRFLVGQNIAINYRSDKYASEISQHIDRWYEEVAFMETEFVSSFPEVTTQVIGHYTQLVYAETSHIGCAVSRFIMKDMFAEFLVCNYGPAGNMLGEEVYKTGSPCSQCPEGLTCSDSYPGLCHTQDRSGEAISTDGKQVKHDIYDSLLGAYGKQGTIADSAGIKYNTIIDPVSKIIENEGQSLTISKQGFDHNKLLSAVKLYFIIVIDNSLTFKINLR